MMSSEQKAGDTNSTMSDSVENVLILQGGGSLGAFGCGVFKALANSNIKIDIIAGTSIGGLNASIIAGSKGRDHPEKILEQYWLELAEGSVDLILTLKNGWLDIQLLQQRHYLQLN
ncbi:MAG: patatin-like phospholipase family protein [Nitrososphaeraceae archaeon]